MASYGTQYPCNKSHMNPPTIGPASSFIDPADITLLRRLAPEAERLGQLHPGQLDLLHHHRWFNLFVPTRNNGLDCSLLDGLRIQEGAAWVDGSFGWTLTLCSGANWFIRFLDSALAGELFSNPFVCFAGSGRPSGIARQNPDGSYTISGHWKYATGAPHATAFTANCVIEKKDKRLLDPNGQPLIYSFVFLASEVQIHSDWSATGLLATASHSFSVDDLRVPANRCFIIDPDAGFISFAKATLAVNSSGMAAHFLDLAAELFDRRNDDKIRRERSIQLLHEARSRLDTARNVFYGAITSPLTATGLDPTVFSLLDPIPPFSTLLAATALQLVDELYPWCGLAAATPGTEINRVWRDIHTASQHGLLLS